MTGLLGMLVLWKYQGWIIFGVVVWLWWKVWQTLAGPWFRRRRARREAERAAILARADYENQLWAQAGIYEGNYPGYTMPITREMMEEVDVPPQVWPLDDYDDGLTEWK